MQDYDNRFLLILGQASNSDLFLSTDEQNRGAIVSSLINEYSKANGIEDRSIVEKTGEDFLSNFNKTYNIPRFQPTQEQFGELFEPIPDVSKYDNIDDREKALDDWREKSFEKASSLRPAEKEDVSIFLNNVTNNLIRKSAAELNGTGFFGDTGYRFAESFARPFHQLIDTEGANRFWAKHAPEDPNKDENFFSKYIASGFGQMTSQLLIAEGLTFAGTPQSIPYVFGAIYGAQYMKEGYIQEYERSGDEDKAWRNSVAQIPAAILDTYSDLFVLGRASKTIRSLGKEFASATTEAAKREILIKALPKFTTEFKKGFLMEGLVGGAGAEFASGLGSYLATGNKDYLRSIYQIAEAGLGEGIVGGFFGGIAGVRAKSGAANVLSLDLAALTDQKKTTQEAIFKALKEKNYNKVIELTNGIETNPDAQNQKLETLDAALGATTDKTTGERVREKVSNPFISSGTKLLMERASNKLDEQIAEIQKKESLTDEDKTKLDNLNAHKNHLQETLRQRAEGTYQGSYELEFSDEDFTYIQNSDKPFQETNRERSKSLFVSKLSNGETLSNNGSNVFINDPKFINDYKSAVSFYGNDRVIVQLSDGNEARIIVNDFDGNKAKLNRTYKYTKAPTKGATPVSFTFTQDGKVKLRIREESVSEYKPLPADFSIIEDKGDEGIIIQKKGSNKQTTLTGYAAEAAREIATQQQQQPNAPQADQKTVTFEEDTITEKDPNSAYSVLMHEQKSQLEKDTTKSFQTAQDEINKNTLVKDFVGIGSYYNGQQGQVQIEGNQFVFKSNNGETYEIGGVDSGITLHDAGITRINDKRVDTISQEKEKTDKFIKELFNAVDSSHHKFIEKAFKDELYIINNLIKKGWSFKVMTREQAEKRYGSNIIGHAFAAPDGSVVFVSDTLNSIEPSVELYQLGLIHESAHAGIYEVKKENPELYNAARESVLNNKELLSVMEAEYPNFDKLSLDQKFHETIRAIVEGKYKGRTTGLSNKGPLAEFLNKLINYIKNVLWTSKDRVVFQFVKNVEDALGINESKIEVGPKGITIKGIQSNVLSDFNKIINGEDVDLENYKRDQLRDLADLMRIKRDRPDIKERLLSRIKEYKPISDSSNTNIINNSQPIIVGSDFFADSGKFYRVIQGDESLNDILQSGEVRTNAAEKIKSGMTLAEKMAARPTAFPSFSKGSASMSYAAENPNHSIIVTADKSLQPSTSGRHSAGKTHFPTVDGVHQKSLGNNFQVYKHIGNGEYELVFDKGMTGEIDNVPFSLATRRSFLKGLASSILLSHQANAGESLNEAMKGVGTNLSPEEEVKFQAWKAKYAPMDSGSDYDLRGAFKEGITPDGERGHFPDTYKFPNHPTFSKESKYSTPEHPGGEWGERNGRTTFTPSEWMAEDASRMEDLKKYFKKVEPDAELIMPGSGGKPVGSTNNNIQNSQPINLGDKFSFRLANELRNADDTFLGLKIANDGTLPTQNLIAKVSKSGITEFEVDSITNLINSLEDNGRVNIDELSNLVDNEPTVVINTLNAFEDKSANIEAAQEYASLYHEAETKGYSAQEIYARTDGFDSLEESEKINISKEDQELFEKLRIAKKNQSVKNNEDIPATGRFDKDPYSNEVLSGVEIEPGHRLIWSGDLSLNIPLESNPIIRQKQIDNFEQVNAFAHEVKFTSQHYNGDVAENQLAFVRGGIHEYQKGNKLPDGTTATETTRIFEIWEVQSDWAASSDAIYKDGVYVGAFVGGVLTDSNINLKDYDENISDNILEPKDTKEGRASLIKNGYTIEKKSPLLKYWESLALKAAINHAKKQGASNIIISDAETAMMTEGHDGVYKQMYDQRIGYTRKEVEAELDYYNKTYPDKNIVIRRENNGDWSIFAEDKELPKISQEKGMRVAYDQRIPNILTKLTNSKPKNVTITEHYKGPSKIFQNPDRSQKNSNTGRMFSIPVNNQLQFTQQPTVDDGLKTIDVSSITGEMSAVRKDAITKINDLRKRKIESKLSVEDKQAWKIIKGIKALAALDDVTLDKYVSLVDDFVSTRTKVNDPNVERIPIESLITQLSEIDNNAKENWFKQQKEDFPQLEGKDFQKDFNGDMDLVSVFINHAEYDESPQVLSKLDNNKEKYLERIDELRDILETSDIKEHALRKVDIAFENNDNKLINDGISLMNEAIAEMKEYFSQYIDSLIYLPVDGLSSREIRNIYYSLMGVVYDGYFYYSKDFVSPETIALLSEDVNALNTYKSTGNAENLSKASGYDVKMRALVDSKGYQILRAITAKFDESIKKAEMIHQQSMVPYQKEALEKAQTKSGKIYNNIDFEKMGMYSISRRIRIGKDIKEEIQRNKDQIYRSIKTLSEHRDKRFNESSEWMKDFADKLYDGVIESENPLQKLEENALSLLDEGMIGYVSDLVDYFAAFKPMSKFTKEFIYGREFNDEINYIPTMIENLNPEVARMQRGENLELNMTANDISNENINVSGLSSTYDRNAKLSQGQALTLNINHLFNNRGRLNFLDDLTSISRKEISTLGNAKSAPGRALMKFLKDERGDQFRYKTFQEAIWTKWKNNVESTQYVHQYQGLIYSLLSRWGGFALASAYQGIAQFTSAIVPYAVANITTPSKIADMFTAFSWMSKYNNGTLTEAQKRVFDKLIYDLKGRHQDQVLDTSVDLGISKDSKWQSIKSSNAFNKLKKVDKTIEKIKFWQFHKADFWAGGPILLAEYLHQEKIRLNNQNLTFDDIVYNPASYHYSIAEAERFIGIGNKSRRGEWLTNRNPFLTVLRHLFLGFGSHRLNNATNFYTELRKINNGNLSAEEVSKSKAYIAAIAAQSATFTLSKIAIMSLMGSIVKSIISKRDEDDEEMYKLYGKEKEELSKEERKLIEAEIATRREIREFWRKQKERTSSGYLMTMGVAKDILTNMFISANIFEPGLDVLFSFPDKYEAEQFKIYKEKKLAELKKKYKNYRNLEDTANADRIRLQISDLEAQNAISFTFPNQGSLIPWSGMYGGAARTIENVIIAGRDKFINGKEFGPSDLSSLAAVFGWNAAELSRYMKALDFYQRAGENKTERIKKNEEASK